MTKVSDVINRFKNLTAKPFLTPVTPATKKIITNIDGASLVTWRSSDLRDGWHWMKPFGKKNMVALDKPVEDWEAQSYLELLKPGWRLRIVHKLGGQSWLCFPFHMADARQKGWSEGPVAVHLVSDAIEPFDVIFAKGPIYNLVYVPGSCAPIDWNHKNRLMEDASKMTLPHLITYAGVEEYTVLAMIQERIKASRLKEAETQRQQQLQTTEGRIKYQLEFLGADLVGWHESGHDIVIHWRDHGKEYRSRINASMGVTSAGICLSGQDSKFNLASLVDVMRQARELNRPGAGGGDDDYNEDD